MKRIAVLLLALCCVAPLLGAAKVGGKLSPDGVEVQCDLPGSQQKANISSRGLGCCVFRSIDHAARWCGEESLYGFPEWLVSKGIPGGGYPQKVDDLIPKIAADRGLPVPQYIQVEGRDIEILKTALDSGRMVSVTYSYSATGRYNGRRIYHMVNAVHGDDKWFAILDNNFPGENAYEWNDIPSFQRTYSPGNENGWAVILLKHGPPPPPRN